MFLGIDVSKASFRCGFFSPTQTQPKRDIKSLPTPPKAISNFSTGFKIKSRAHKPRHSRNPLCAFMRVWKPPALTDTLWRGPSTMPGHAVSVVNPAAVHALGKSQLKRLKTDKADAILIARFCALQKPALWTPPSPEHEQLQLVVRRIEALEEMKQMEENRLEALHTNTDNDPVRASLLDHIAYLQRQIEGTRGQIKEQIQAHPLLCDQAQTAQLDSRHRRDHCRRVAGGVGRSDSVPQRASGRSLCRTCALCARIGFQCARQTALVQNRFAAPCASASTFPRWPLCVGIL